MREINANSDFEKVIMPHFKAAYNLARYLHGNDEDASDLVQDACLKALRFYNGFRGDNPRAWLLTIVRNTFYTGLAMKRSKGIECEFNESIHDTESDGTNPETLVINNENIMMVRSELEKLPPEFRETIVLREMEGFSYKEIAEIIKAPIGTVMSRLARGRKVLMNALKNKQIDRNDL